MRRWYVWLPISALLLGLVVWRTRPWEAMSLAARLDPGPLLAAIALNVVVVVAWAVRSHGLMAGVGSPVGVIPLIPVTSFANTVNNLTPASSGEVLRALVLHRRWAVPYDRSTAVILVERLWAIGLMLGSAMAASVGTLVPAGPVVLVLGWLALALAVAGPPVCYALGLRPGRLLRRGPAGTPTHRRNRVSRLIGHLAEVDDRLAELLSQPVRSIQFLVSTAVIFLVYAAQLWLILDALGAPLSLAGTWAALGLATCAGVLSALPFGLGAADAVLVILLGVQGVEPAAAGAAALLYRAVATLPLGILGALSWIYLSRGEATPLSGEAGG